MNEPVKKYDIQLRSPGEIVRRLDRQLDLVDFLLAEPPGAALAPRAVPFVNSLGMRFVPVPGIDAWFSVWQTRVKDYAVYAKANRGVDRKWKGLECPLSGGGYRQGPDHPVANVSWEDAKAFCDWLSQKEGRTYRLPTDHEWSVAVGIGHLEDPQAAPKDKHNIVPCYPWGNEWPPPPGSGNFFGAEAGEAFEHPHLEGYRDDYPFTAPVGSFALEHHGIKDLSGNVLEWCEDWYSSEQKYRVLRGGSWFSSTEMILRSSLRGFALPSSRIGNNGYRCVVFPKDMP